MDTCQWNLDLNYGEDEGNWRTSCGQEFFFDEGMPEDNYFKYCPFCGRPLEQVLPEVPPEEEE